MKTFYQELVEQLNSGWRIELSNGQKPAGSYFIYQQVIGPPMTGGTQPVCSYDLSSLKPFLKKGGFIFDENFKVLYKC